MRGIGRIKQFYGRYKSSFAQSALILAYHRIAELDSDPQLLATTPQHFAEHLEVLAAKANPIPLQKLARNLMDGNSPNRGVAITFDDGYSDNLYSAKPILERYNIPATVFIASGTIGKEREFWWDELERLLLQPGRLPEALQLNIDGEIMDWEFGRAVEYSQEEYLKNRAWNVTKKPDPSERQRIYRALHQRLRTVPFLEQQRILDELSGWAGTREQARSGYLALSPTEICALIRGGLIEAGAHTITHPSLAMLADDEQLEEIGGGKTGLEKIIGQPVVSFAYPYGSRSDYSEKTVAMVRQAGFTCACSNFPGLTWRNSDPFQLPRLLVRDCDGDTFDRSLRSWWGG